MILIMIVFLAISDAIKSGGVFFVKSLVNAGVEAAWSE